MGMSFSGLRVCPLYRPFIVKKQVVNALEMRLPLVFLTIKLRCKGHTLKFGHLWQNATNEGI